MSISIKSLIFTTEKDFSFFSFTLFFQTLLTSRSIRYSVQRLDLQSKYLTLFFVPSSSLCRLFGFLYLFIFSLSLSRTMGNEITWCMLESILILYVFSFSFSILCLFATGWWEVYKKYSFAFERQQQQRRQWFKWKKFTSIKNIDK